VTTSFPGGIDNYTNPQAADFEDSAGVEHDVQHANVNDAVEAIETELGINPSGASATVDARIGATEAVANAGVTKTGGGKETVFTNALSGTTETLNLASGNVFDITLSANCTFTFTGSTSGVSCSLLLILRQDATGSRTATWPAAVDWPGGTSPTLTTTANAVNILSFFTVNGGAQWFGVVCGTGFA
jgi:hypothetical protein